MYSSEKVQVYLAALRLIPAAILLSHGQMMQLVTDARVKLIYYNADGTLSEVISSWGYMYGLFDSGFFYEGKGTMVILQLSASTVMAQALTWVLLLMELSKTPLTCNPIRLQV